MGYAFEIILSIYVIEIRCDQRATMGRYEGCMESPWDDISIQYVLVCTHVAKKRYVEAFKEESQLVSSVIFQFIFMASFKAQ